MTTSRKPNECGRKRKLCPQWFNPKFVSPPGETIQDILDERKMSQADLARKMKRPMKTINEIIKGKARITEYTAVQLETVLGGSAEFWMARESHYRLFLARKKLKGGKK